MKKNCYYNCKNSYIHITQWIPKEKPIGIISIIHGMQEYIGRYDDFAEFMKEKGFIVVGFDLEGHGFFASSKNKLGVINENSLNQIKKNLLFVKEKIEKQHKNLPFIVLGHSMGSFILRNLIKDSDINKHINAAIIMGTGNVNILQAKSLKIALNITSFIKKDLLYRSTFINNILFGKYNKKFNNNSKFEWLSRDQNIVKTYEMDNCCNFIFTLKGFYALQEYIFLMNKNIKNTKNIPLLFISGKNDPVGNYGKGVQKIHDKYTKLGFNTTLQIYPDCRHELLNEINKEQVYNDIYNWIKSKNVIV